MHRFRCAPKEAFQPFNSCCRSYPSFQIKSVHCNTGPDPCRDKFSAALEFQTSPAGLLPWSGMLVYVAPRYRPRVCLPAELDKESIGLHTLGGIARQALRAQAHDAHQVWDAVLDFGGHRSQTVASQPFISLIQSNGSHAVMKAKTVLRYSTFNSMRGVHILVTTPKSVA